MLARGINKELPCVEVKKSVIESTSGYVNIRVKAIQPVRRGEIVIEAVSDRKRKALTCCLGLSSTELRTKKSRVLNPEVIFYKLQCRIMHGELLQSMYEKILNGIVERKVC